MTSETFWLEEALRATLQRAVEDERRGTEIAIWRGYGQQLLDRYYHALRKHSVASLLGGTTL